jgi:hypothetical protein
MGAVIRRKQLIVVPNKYWESSIKNIEWIVKESDAEKH